MPWKETSPVNERLRFVLDAEEGLFNFKELCERYGISRQQGCKWLRRYEAEGPRGLEDRSCCPRSCPHETSARAVEILLETKLAHPSWGPKKLLPYLQKRHRLKLPAPSTASNILAKHGLVQHNKRRHRHKHPGAHGIKAEAPNDLWTVDFKGQFKLKDGQWCYPLTIADQHSRYLLACDVKPDVKQHGVFPVFERLFKDHGLPKAIRSDNGAPFCSSTSIHGLSNLNVWWAKLGIEHSRMDPASPQQNGAHERMHRTLKAEVAKPPSASMRAQQRRFNAWRREYNEDRPHEFLDDDTPAEHYEDSPRPFPKKLPEPEYPAHFRTPTVSKGGNFRFKEKVFFISNTLSGSRIGLEEVDDGLWNVHFYDLLLAKLDERDWTLNT